MKRLILKTISINLVSAFFFTSMAPAYDNLATGVVSGKLRTNGDDVQAEVRATARLLGVMRKSDMPFSINDLARQREPALRRDLGIDGTAMTFDEVMDELNLQSQGQGSNARAAARQKSFLGYNHGQVLVRCAKRAWFNNHRTFNIELGQEYALGSGELALPRLVKLGPDRNGIILLQTHPEYEENLGLLRRNDLLFKTPGGRYVSLWQALDYDMGMHELAWRNKKNEFKGGGHLEWDADLGSTLNEDEADAYMFNGRYTFYNEAVRLWYIFSFCQDLPIWLNNENFGNLLRRVSDPGNNDPQAKAFRVYFPRLAKNRKRLEKAINLALWINYHYFIHPAQKSAKLANARTADPSISVSAVTSLRARNCTRDGFRGIGAIPNQKERSKVWEVRASNGLDGVMPDRPDANWASSDLRLQGLSEEAKRDVAVNQRQQLPGGVLTIGITVVDRFSRDSFVVPGTENCEKNDLVLLGKTEGSIDENGKLIPEHLAKLTDQEREIISRNKIGGGPAFSTTRVFRQLTRRIGDAISSLTNVRFISCANMNEDDTREIMSELRDDLGVDTSRVKDSSMWSGRNTATTLAKERESDSSRIFLHDVGASSDLTINDVSNNDFTGRAIVHIGGIELGTPLFKDAEKLLEMAKEYGGTEATKAQGIQGAITVWDTVVDKLGLWRKYFKLGRKPEDQYKIFQNIDVFTPSIGEARKIYGDAMSDESLFEFARAAQAKKIAEEATPEQIVDFFISKGVKAVFLKMDTGGVLVKTTRKSIFRTEETFTLPILPAFNKVSGTGTGDAFAAGLLNAIGRRVTDRSWTPKKCAKFASVVGGMCVEHVGGTIGGRDFVDAMRFMDMYDKLENYRYVGLSVGGNKVMIAVENGLRQTIDTETITFEEAFGERGKEVKDKVTADEIAKLMRDHIIDILKKNNIHIRSIDQIFVGIAGPLDEIREILGYPEPTTNLPFHNYLLMEELASKLYGKLGKNADRLSIHTGFVMNHDGKAGNVGEFKEEPGMNGTTVIQGSGENFTASKEGVYFTAGEAITECGHTTIGTPMEGEEGRHFPKRDYRFVGRAMGKKHPLQIVHSIPKDVVGTPQEKQYILSEEASNLVFGDANADPSHFIWRIKTSGIVGNEYDVEDVTSGTAIKKMLARKNDLAADFGGTADSYQNLNSGADLSREAANNNPYAKKIIEYIGGEMGRALAAYIHEFKDEKFVEHIRLVSTVGENLGKGVDADKDQEGRDVYIRSVQDACEDALKRKGIEEKRANELSRGIVRSEGNAVREIRAAAPQVRPFAQPSDDELKNMAPLVVKEGQDYYVLDSLFKGEDLTLARDIAGKLLKGNLKTFSNLEDLAQNTRMPGTGKRACVDLCGMSLTEEGLKDFFDKNAATDIMNARFINSEAPSDFAEMPKEEKIAFIKTMLLRMSVVRSLEADDVRNITPRYLFARYYLHPYLPLGADVNSYIARVVLAPTDDPKAFVRNMIYIIKAALMYRPIETYDPRALRQVDELLLKFA